MKIYFLVRIIFSFGLICFNHFLIDLLHLCFLQVCLLLVNVMMLPEITATSCGSKYDACRFRCLPRNSICQEKCEMSLASCGWNCLDECRYEYIHCRSICMETPTDPECYPKCDRANVACPGNCN